MSIFQKVTLESLKKNKVRTIVTIIGVILSASMITAVTTSVASVQKYLINNAIYRDGDWHISALETDAKVFEVLEESENVESYVYSEKIGYAIAEGCTNEYKPYLYLIGANKQFMEKMPVHLTGGRLPKTSEEILLPEHLAENGEVYYKVGDVLTLEIGERVSDGYILGQYNPYQKAEELPQNEMTDNSESSTEDGNHVQNQETKNNQENTQNSELSQEENQGTETQNSELIQEETQGIEAQNRENQLEYLEVKETRTYTVVGFYERPDFENYTAPGYTAITIPDKIRAEDTIFNVYYKVTDPKHMGKVYEEMPTEYMSNENSNVLTYLGVWGYNGFYSILYGLSTIIIGLIMFGSISLIYNAFSISVSERTKQFGLLSSIGATKRQLRNMVLFEGMVVSAIGIPLGILAGVGGMGITFYFIGNKFNDITDYAIPLKLYVYPWMIIITFLITFVTIMISAWIPSKRATLITAVEAIRQSKDIKINKRRKKNLQKKHKTNAKTGSIYANEEIINFENENFLFSSNTFMEKLLYRFFGLPGMIADKYYRRSKKKYRATVISLFMSIVLFVSASAFTKYFTDLVEAGYEGDSYDISYTYDPTMYLTKEEMQNENFSNLIAQKTMSQEELAKLFAETEYVTETAFVTNYTKYIKLENQYISKEYLEYQKERNEVIGNEVIGLEQEETYTNIHLGVVFVDDATYEAFLKEQKLDKNVYMNAEQPIGIAFDGKSDFDYDLEKIITANVLKSKDSKIVIENETSVKELQLGTILYERPYFIGDAYTIAVAYPYSAMDVVLEGVEYRGYVATHYIKSDDHEKSFAEMKNMLVENGLSKNYLYNMAEALEENRSLVLIINVFSYGFIVLISLIAAANVFNTISTNIHLRRREFAMLKSVGMSNKELNRMMNFECVLYGSRALLYGLPISMVITWFIYKVVSEGYTAGFSLPWSAIGIATGSVFLVVFVTMMYSMRKIKADNPIDALKNDNL